MRQGDQPERKTNMTTKTQNPNLHPKGATTPVVTMSGGYRYCKIGQDFYRVAKISKGITDWEHPVYVTTSAMDARQWIKDHNGAPKQADLHQAHLDKLIAELEANGYVVTKKGE